MQDAPTTRRRLANAKLQLDELVQMLLADGHLTQADADKVLAARSAREPDVHPLIWVGDHKLTDAGNAKAVLTTEALTEWLAAKTHLPYLHIDPLKIDVARVCSVVTHAYAARYHILPVEVSTQDVTVATAEPFDREWQTEMERMLGLRIRTVL
ncbi:MAG: type II/IV secretion system protein, partial [Proteobacteria bacterium]|nr:type II/IV secretion system protein [Pseudomonadota bacterium]